MQESLQIAVRFTQSFYHLTVPEKLEVSTVSIMSRNIISVMKLVLVVLLALIAVTQVQGMPRN